MIPFSNIGCKIYSEYIKACHLLTFICLQNFSFEKHPWRSVNFSKVAGFKSATLLKLTLLHGSFSRFLNCTNGTKPRNAAHLPVFLGHERKNKIQIILILSP